MISSISCSSGNNFPIDRKSFPPHDLFMAETLQKKIMYIVRETLLRHNGNKVHAARELGITARTIRNWVEKNDELQEFKQAKRK